MTTPDKMRQNVLEVLALLVCHSLSADAGSPHIHIHVPVHTHTHFWIARCGLRGCKNMAHFISGPEVVKATKSGWSLLHFVSRRPREMYCGHECLSGCNLREW